LKYNIVYDKPGRLRLRMGRGAFSEGQGYGLEALLAAKFTLDSAEANSRNGGLLVCFLPAEREGILAFIDSLDNANIPVSDKKDVNRMRELDDNFAVSLASVVFKHFFAKLFLPAPLRAIIAVRRALIYWKKGAKALGKGKLNVDVLDAAAVAASIFQRDFATATSIMTLLRITDLLEDYTKKKVNETLSQSLALNIDRVWLAEGVSIPLSEVEIGDLIRVRTASVIPLDGEVVQGTAMVNESSMTGEALSVERGVGSSVYAGTVLEEGSVVIKVRTLADNTRIQNIVSLIEGSENLKAGVQSKAEKLADYIVPFSFFASAGILFLTGSLAKAMSVLMVDYSCAIKLTTPICVISAMREAANSKILVKGGKHLEAFANADTIVFDKTGTLTAACPEVAKVVPFGSRSREEVLRISACLEEHFPHSVAKAIIRRAEIEGLDHKEEHADLQYIVAHGISSMLNDERVLIGSWHFIFEDEAIPIEAEHKRIIEAESEGYSVIFLAIGGRAAGMICVEDPVRMEAALALENLRNLGINRIVMLTGDSESAAKTVCQKLGITEYHASLLPEDKASIIRRYREAGQTVIMVGDGINDSPALSCADVSVAMKDGADIAREIADITLLTENLDGLITLRQLSTALFGRIHKNYRFIVGFNTALLLLGLGGTISASTSALLHNSSTLALSGLSMRPYTEARLPSV